MKTTTEKLSVLSTAQKTAVIVALTEHIQSECSPVDMEQRFRDTIDELYSFDSIGGPFSGMSPSRVLEECDPIAFRCGVSDSSDHENVVEIEGEYYDSDKVDEARDSFASNLQDELNGEQEDLNLENEEESPDEETVAELSEKVALLEAKITEVENHAF